MEDEENELTWEKILKNLQNENDPIDYLENMIEIIRDNTNDTNLIFKINEQLSFIYIQSLKIKEFEKSVNDLFASYKKVDDKDKTNTLNNLRFEINSLNDIDKKIQLHQILRLSLKNNLMENEYLDSGIIICEIVSSERCYFEYNKILPSLISDLEDYKSNKLTDELNQKMKEIEIQQIKDEKNAKKEGEKILKESKNDYNNYNFDDLSKEEKEDSYPKRNKNKRYNDGRNFKDYDYKYNNNYSNNFNNDNNHLGNFNSDNIYRDNFNNNNNFKNNSKNNNDRNLKKIVENNNILKFNNKRCFTQVISEKINYVNNIDINDNLLNILIITESSSLSKKIAKVLSSNKTYKECENQNCNFYYFEGKFKGIKSNFKLYSISGHMYETKLIGDDNQNIDELLVTKKKVSEQVNHFEKDIRYLSNGIDILILWINCDQDRENISFEVIYNALPFLNKKSYQQIYRVNFSSFTENEIKKSFNEISEYPNKYISFSIDARQIIDIMVGLSIKKILQKDKILNQKISSINFDSNQIPTLYLCVDKYRSNLKKNNLNFNIFIELKIDQGRSIKLYLDKNYKDENQVKEIVLNIKRNKKLEIINIQKNIIIKEHPLGLNTIDMIKMSSKYLGLSPKETIITAGKLFYKGCISFPKTESKKYPSSFNFKENLQELSNDYDVDELLNNINKIDKELISKDKSDILIHPPITPFKKPLKSNQESIRLFDFICNCYFASLSQDMKCNQTIYEIKIGDENYKSTCLYVSEKGYMKYCPFLLRDYLTKKSLLKKNFKYEIINVDYECKKNEDYITEGELIDEMVENNLGIDYSLCSHIDNIKNNGYVELVIENEKRKLKPTQIGKRIINILEKEKQEFIKPEIRKEAEKLLLTLAEGKESYEYILTKIFDLYDLL